MLQQLATSKVVFAVEPFKIAFNEAGPLMELHYDEIAKNKQLLKLNPDVAMYERAEIEGKLLLITARAEGTLVGYFMWIMIKHSHYSDTIVAEEDLHYLLPEYRRGLTGYLFIKAAMEAATIAGAKLLLLREKIGHEHPAMMKRLGFTPTDITYTRVVS